ncbi:helix-turn-helix protein [Blastococcus colisei]|uniref:Helix-turn-helix protein n=1 Tax=Blastococcus colisei TaxID=1564162 RepID=A0A543P142_9ACTN|nr:helix-turn-helix transcriptional regulator [Blastococcus colisei]TQN37812.1 helix-turn-helix protein [Blastococcus colisei]
MSTDQSVDLYRPLAGRILMSVADVFDLCGVLRRIRRIADVSQRQLAAAAGLSVSAVAHAEAGTRDLPVTALARAAGLAGLRIALLDDHGDEVGGMHPGAVRDRGGRRFPAHLDTMLSEERSSRWDHRPRLDRPTYTFDRRRTREGPGRRTTGRADDHLLPQPGDAPEERAARRRAEQWRRRTEERERRYLAGEVAGRGDVFTCTCPPRCDELDDRSGPPVHAEDCPCSCDLA